MMNLPIQEKKPNKPVPFMFRFKIPHSRKIHNGMNWTLDDGSVIKIKTIQSIDTTKGYVEIVGWCHVVTEGVSKLG